MAQQRQCGMEARQVCGCRQHPKCPPEEGEQGGDRLQGGPALSSLEPVWRPDGGVAFYPKGSVDQNKGVNKTWAMTCS